MIFGDRLEPAASAVSTATAQWLDRSCRSPWGTVGSLVPNGYESFLRISAPDPSLDDWWSAYRLLFAAVGAVGRRHTTRPDRARFAIWDGHGFDRIQTSIAWREEPADEAEGRRREAERARRRDADARRNAEIAATLDRLPRLRRPHRSYYLLDGPVGAVDGLRYPDGDRWRNPDLLWPDDRAWFVATDVDLWSLYVGGRHDVIDELADATPTACEPVELDTPLQIES